MMSLATAVSAARLPEDDWTAMPEMASCSLLEDACPIEPVPHNAKIN